MTNDITFELASIISRISIEELESLTKQGYFKTNKIGSETLIDLDSFDTYLANKDEQKIKTNKTNKIVGKPKLHLKETVLSPTGKEVDKIDRYGWTVENKMGKFALIDKSELSVNEDYQRAADKRRIFTIARNFDWISFGALAVAHRDGKYHVMDGQHRYLAAMIRSDIPKVPCMVYETESPVVEAEGFISTNTSRKAVATIDIFKAKLIANDEEAKQIDKLLKFNGITLNKNANKAKDLKSIAACFRMFRDNKSHFEQVLSLASELSIDKPIHEKILEGLFYISKYSTTPLTNERFRKKILKCGYDDLIIGANDAAVYYQRGGARVWAFGMMKKLNRNQKEDYKFKLKTDVEA
jgi:hypothetical protein